MTDDPETNNLANNITDIRPKNPWIKVLFHGLMTGCFRDDNKSYEVGMLRDVDHTIQLNVWDVGKKNPQPFTNTSRAVLRINHQDSNNNLVQRFQLGQEFDRSFDSATLGELRHDFRWLLDFEAPDMHGDKLSKVSGSLHPRFSLENSGVIFTLVRSVPILKNRREAGVPRTRLLGRIGQIVAAYIFLPVFPAGQYPAELIIDNVVRYRFEPIKNYEIVLRNDCPDDSPACFDESDVLDTTTLNRAFRSPSSKEHFTLLLGLDRGAARRMMMDELANGIKEECGFELGAQFDFLKLRDDQIEASRYNPCGKAFYGQSTSLD